MARIQATAGQESAACVNGASRAKIAPALRAQRRCCWWNLQAATAAVWRAVMWAGAVSRLKGGDLERQGQLGLGSHVRSSRGEMPVARNWVPLLESPRLEFPSPPLSSQQLHGNGAPRSGGLVPPKCWRSEACKPMLRSRPFRRRVAEGLAPLIRPARGFGWVAPGCRCRQTAAAHPPASTASKSCTWGSTQQTPGLVARGPGRVGMHVAGVVIRAKASGDALPSPLCRRFVPGALEPGRRSVRSQFRPDRGIPAHGTPIGEGSGAGRPRRGLPPEARRFLEGVAAPDARDQHGNRGVRVPAALGPRRPRLETVDQIFVPDPGSAPALPGDGSIPPQQFLVGRNSPLQCRLALEDRRTARRWSPPIEQTLHAAQDPFPPDSAADGGGPPPAVGIAERLLRSSGGSNRSIAAISGPNRRVKSAASPPDPARGLPGVKPQRLQHGPQALGVGAAAVKAGAETVSARG